MAYVTIKDLARELGLSTSTVSRALRDMPDVKPQTKQAVLELASKLNYQPNLFASSLVSQKSPLIGVVVPMITNHFFSRIVQGIQSVAHERDYQVIIVESNQSVEQEIRSVNTLLSIRAAGILIGPFAGDENVYEHLQDAQKQGVPVVFFDGLYEQVEASRVIIDDFHATLEAMEYLIATGCKRIAHLCGPRMSYIGKRRVAGYLAALKKHGLPVREDWIISTDFTLASAKEHTQQLLAESAPPDAILAVNDLSAIGALKAAQEAGLRVPEDLSLIGYSNNPISALIEPSITTVFQPAIDMGMLAARLLFAQLDGSQTAISTHKMPTQLLLRDSTRNLPE